MVIETYEKILLELKSKFSSNFKVILRDYKTVVDQDGNDTRCEARFELVALNKYISIWMVNSLSPNFPFSITIAIGDNKSDYSFLLTDYLSLRNIVIDRSIIFGSNKNENDLFISCSKFINYLEEILQNEELTKMLFSDYKINVPTDYSPYK